MQHDDVKFKFHKNYSLHSVLNFVLRGSRTLLVD
jgi:hypothetical protein